MLLTPAQFKVVLHHRTKASQRHNSPVSITLMAFKTRETRDSRTIQEDSITLVNSEIQWEHQIMPQEALDHLRPVMVSSRSLLHNKAMQLLHRLQGSVCLNRQMALAVQHRTTDHHLKQMGSMHSLEHLALAWPQISQILNMLTTVLLNKDTSPTRSLCSPSCRTDHSQCQTQHNRSVSPKQDSICQS